MHALKAQLLSTTLIMKIIHNLISDAIIGGGRRGGGIILQRIFYLYSSILICNSSLELILKFP
jgi:hypothetical protein